MIFRFFKILGIFQFFRLFRDFFSDFQIFLLFKDFFREVLELRTPGNGHLGIIVENQLHQPSKVNVEMVLPECVLRAAVVHNASCAATKTKSLVVPFHNRNWPSSSSLNWRCCSATSSADQPVVHLQHFCNDETKRFLVRWIFLAIPTI